MNEFKQVWFTKRRVSIAVLAFTVWLCAGAAFVEAQTPPTARQVDGTVMDPQGLPISGATVTVTQKQGTLQKSTQTSAGKFKVDGLTPGTYDVKAEAPGFAAMTATVDLRTVANFAVQLRLEPAGLSDVVSVAATRSEQRISSVAESVSVLSGDDIRKSPAIVADDVLRQLPSFSLFRRSSSLATHPTSQGVSLRGIGPSGGGRTLVLLDGMPFNDPFGGWVYWTRVPLMEATKIEVVDGTTSGLYGNYALGGVISIDTRIPEKRTVIFQPQFGIFSDKLHSQFGNLYTPKMDFYASDRYGKLGLSLEGSTMNSDGYPVIAATERGLVDTKASVHSSNFTLKADYAATSSTHVYFRTGRFTESRNNAKTTTTTSPGISEANDTRWWFFNSGVKSKLPDGSELQVGINTDFEEFHSNFLAVPNAVTRATARQTLTQRVPVKAAGGMVQWSKAAGDKNFVTAGLDWRWVMGSTNETSFDSTLGTRPILTRVAGGRQETVGGFVQDMIQATTRLRITVGMRLDHALNYRAAKTETDLDPTDTTLASSATFADKKNTVGSPHGSALYKVSDRVSVWAGTSWGFRVPTLNELYRQFSVGAVVTRANDQLGPERLFEWESGVNIEPVKNLTWRNTIFDDRFNHAVSNITIGTNLAQRQNVGQSRIWGIQSDAEYRLIAGWKVTAAYLYDVARVRKFDSNPVLIGNFLPQVPRHRGTFGLAYSNKKLIDASAQLHYTSAQFDDDLNTPSKRLGGYTTVDFSSSRKVQENVDVFFSVQNVFNKEFVVQTGPRTIGAPRQFVGGLRFHL